MTADQATTEALRKKLQSIISTAQILDLRASGHSALVPREFDRFDDEMLAEVLIRDAATVLAEVREAA